MTKDEFAVTKISVIVPVYNGERFIPSVLEYMNAQTIKDFEVIFVNDGSKDRSKELLDQAASTPSAFTIRVIHQENKGVSAARNVGLDVANGSNICFVDVDDKIAPDYLEVLYNALKTTGLRVAVSHITKKEHELSCCEEINAQRVPSCEFLRRFLYRGIQYHICACMFERSCFTERRVRFPEGYRYSEDVYVMWQIFAAENAVAETHRKLYYYFDNPYSAMNNGIDLRRLDAVKLMKKLEQIIAELSPEFSAEFNRYVVARHHWSILWQSANRLNTYREFMEYGAHFNMKSELMKLFRYPELRISLSSLAYVICPAFYYYLLRLYFRICNRK